MKPGRKTESSQGRTHNCIYWITLFNTLCLCGIIGFAVFIYNDLRQDIALVVQQQTHTVSKHGDNGWSLTMPAILKH